jgi:hypothetical protein
MFFLYKDVSKSVFNHKTKQWPVQQIVFIHEGESILEADNALEGSGLVKCKAGIPPGTITCMALTTKELLDFVKKTFNEAQNAAEKFYRQSRDYEYKIFGLENPVLLVDYSYPQI